MKADIRAIISFFQKLFSEKESLREVSRENDSIVKSNNITHTLSNYEIRRIAYHESGHILMLACFETLDNDVEAKIKWVATESNDSIGGYVDVPQIANLVKTDKAMIWEMLMYLAGYSAEVFFLDESSNGSSDDYCRWIVVAKEYLASFGCKSRYYPHPKNKFEHESNQVLLDNVFNEQQDLVKDLFSRNKLVLNKIADELYLKRKLNSDEISELLSGVDFPDGIPNGIKIFS